MTLEFVAEVPISLLSLSRFPGDIVAHAECDDERVVKIFRRTSSDQQNPKALDKVLHMAPTPRRGLAP